MKPLHLLAIVLIAFVVSGCNSSKAGNASDRLTEDDKHRLYSAALNISESPLDNDTFKQVCREIGIIDAHGRPNEQYMAFVSRHIDWATQSETAEFRREINSKEKAGEYIKKHLSGR